MTPTQLTQKQVLEKIRQTKLEKKDTKAWSKLLELGEKISKKWKNPKTSWQLIIEGRR